jgi:O-antigen/teichoic acid export membrane protein
MGQIARQGILTTLASYLGVLIGYFNVLWLYPYALNPEEIGTFRTIQDIAILLVPFAQMGLSNGMVKFFPKVNRNPSSFLTLSLLFSVFGFVIIAILFFLLENQITLIFQQKSAEILPFLAIILYVLFLSVINSILDAYSRCFYMIAFPTFIREVLLRLFLTLLVTFYFIQWIDFKFLMYGLVMVYFSSLASMLFYLMHKKVLKFSFDFKSLPRGLVKKLLTYSSITFLGTAGALLIAKVDSIMVSAMIGLEANAIYIIGYSIALVIEMPRRAISQTVTPLIADHFENNRIEEVQKLYQKIAIHQLLICMLLFLGIWSNVNNIYQFIPKANLYETGKWVVFWIGIGKISDILFSINGEILLYSKHYKFNVVATVLMLFIIVGLNYLLIPIYGIEGAAFASFVSMLIFNLIKYLYLKTKLDLSPFSWEIPKILVLAFITFVIQQQFFEYIPVKNLIFGTLLRSAIIVVIYIFGIFVLNLIPDTIKKRIQKTRFGS